MFPEFTLSMQHSPRTCLISQTFPIRIPHRWLAFFTGLNTVSQWTALLEWSEAGKNWFES
jgi:hypothetical protein